MDIKLLEGGCIPTKGSEGAAGYDLYVAQDTVINPRGVNCGRTLVPLHLCMEIPEGQEALIDPRSGCSAKGMPGISKDVFDFIMGQYNTDCNQLSEEQRKRIDKEIADNMNRFDADVLEGKIDSDYRGIISVIVHSQEDRPFVVTKGTRIAQITFIKVESHTFRQVENLSTTPRQEGGFGHTGIL